MNSLRSFFIAAVLAAFCSNLLGQAGVGSSRDAKWTSERIKARLSSPALDEESLLIYAGGSDGRLYAFDMEDGSLIYPTPAPRFGGGQCSAPLLGPDGTLYLAFTDGTLVAVTNAWDSPGLMWRYRTRAAFVGSPAMDEDGMLYIGSKDNQLHAVPSDQGTNFRATNAWTFNAKGDVTSSPVVTLLGDIVFLSGGTVFTLTSDGVQAGVFHAGSSIHDVPVVAEDGTIYFGANNGFIYKVAGGAGTGTNASAGTNGLIFRLNAGADVRSSGASGAAGRLFIGTDGGRLLCTDDEGVIWRFPITGRTKGAIRSDISLGADGTVYAGTDGHTLYAVTAAGREKWYFNKFKGAMRSSPVIDRDGTVYFSVGRSIYAVLDDVPASDTPWSQFRGDAQHTATSTHDEIFVTQDPASLTNTVGTTAVFTVVAQSSAPLFYQWTRDNVVLAGATNPTLAIINVQATNAGNYSVSISNGFQPVEVRSAELVIASAPPVIVSDLTDHFISVGSILRLEIGVAGTAPLSFQWHTNGVSVPDATNASLNFVSDVPLPEPIAIDVTVMNAIGTNYSRTSLVTVVSLNLTRPAISIGAGNRFSSALVSNQLFTWGSDATGQLGDGGATNRFIPTRTSTNMDWLSVSAGGRASGGSSAVAHALALRMDGSLFAWGANARGQLGVGTTNDSRVPVRVGGDTNWVQVEAGATHSVALRTNGTIWAWGGNQNGELGLGHTNNVLIPTQVGVDSAWVEVRAGGSFTLARRADGTIWGWGRNDSGQLGNSSTNEVHSPVRVGTNGIWSTISAGVSHSLGLRTDGSLWMWGRNFGLTNRNMDRATNVFPTPIQIGTNADWKVIDAGFDHSLAVNTAGKMFAFGANNVGQLGNGETGLISGQTNLANRPLPVPIGLQRDWASIEAGVKHSVARATDGSIWAWGWNNAGQVGNGSDFSNTNIPVLLVFTNFANVNTNGTNVGPPIFLRQPASTNVPPGGTATFSATVTGATPFTMLWYFNTNTGLVDETNLTLRVVNVQVGGTYNLVITNSVGWATSSIVTLTATNLASFGGPSFFAGVSKSEAVNSSPVIAPVLLSVVPSTNGISVSVLNSNSDQSYVLEFKNLLTDPAWTAIATNRGPVTNIMDPGAPGTSRFYRLRVQ